jgi:protein farnesyltransferase/geranylgeranyltransferase type-1 subunit alpha
LERPDDVYSSHALDLLADIYAEEDGKKDDAKKALDLLATKYDPIKARYWNYRKGLLDQTTAVAA